MKELYIYLSMNYEFIRTGLLIGTAIPILRLAHYYLSHDLDRPSLTYKERKQIFCVLIFFIVLNTSFPSKDYLDYLINLG